MTEQDYTTSPFAGMADILGEIEEIIWDYVQRKDFYPSGEDRSHLLEIEERFELGYTLARYVVRHWTHR